MLTEGDAAGYLRELELPYLLVDSEGRVSGTLAA